MDTHTTLKGCIFINAISLFVLIVFCVHFSDSNVAFMKYGPQTSLVVLGVTIDTWTRYLLLQLFICCFQVTDVIINEFANPILGFNVYNPDKKEITEFTKFQLQFYCQSMWFITNIKTALMLLVSISQVDIAISKVVYAEITSIFTIRSLINAKTFLPLETKNRNDMLQEILLEN